MLLAFRETFPFARETASAIDVRKKDELALNATLPGPAFCVSHRMIIAPDVGALVGVGEGVCVRVGVVVGVIVAVGVTVAVGVLVGVVVTVGVLVGVGVAHAEITPVLADTAGAD